jgi:three-Cys-motif partner protein
MPFPRTALAARLRRGASAFLLGARSAGAHWLAVRGAESLNSGRATRQAAPPAGSGARVFPSRHARRLDKKRFPSTVSDTWAHPTCSEGTCLSISNIEWQNEVDNLMTEKTTLWPMTRHTAAKHTILRKYLDAWMPILGGGRFARYHLVLIDAFAGPGRYSTGEDGSPLLMVSAYLEHSGEISATPHFFFIEDDHERIAHLRGEIDALEVPGCVEVEVIEGSFDIEFPALISRLEGRFGSLPPTFAFIDPFGASDLPVALSTPLLDVPRCEVLVYFPVSFLARFGEQPEFLETMNSVFSGERWRDAFDAGIEFEARQRMLLDLFIGELRKRVPYVRAFAVTPAHESGANTYHLVFGTANADQGLRKMKDAMWKVDPVAGASFRDSTLADHPVLFEESPTFGELEQMLRDHFGTDWFTIEDAERFTLLETPYRDNGHLKRPTLKPAEDRDALEVERRSGQRAGSFSAGTRMRFK